MIQAQRDQLRESLDQLRIALVAYERRCVGKEEAYNITTINIHDLHLMQNWRNNIESVLKAEKLI